MASTKQQQSSSTSTPALVIPEARFQRLVCEIIQDLHLDLQTQAKAVILLQEAAESHLVGLFKDTNLCALGSKRVTILPEDMEQALHVQRRESALRVKEPHAHTVHTVQHHRHLKKKRAHTSEREIACCTC